ncbi:MAG: helix-turn-helix domain-containing protein [Propionibacteriaceae bacterium]|nr:helix-turn-helix domain-containing protein [Propionibacteriaceae bacterium]
MSALPKHPDVSAVLGPLSASLPELADATCRQIYAELASYTSISHEALTAAVRRNLDTAMKALASGRIPHPGQLCGAALTARERFDAGVPVEEIVRGFRISIALIHERFVDLAVTRRLSAEATVGGVRLMWGLADAFTTRIITEYHALEVDAALRDAHRRASTVRALLAGETPADATTTLNPTAQYAAIRCHIADAAASELLRRRLEASGSTPTTRAVVVVDGGQCLGLVATRPSVDDVPVGIGPFVRIDDLPRSDRVAQQALALARHLDRTGPQGLDALGWRLAAASRPDVWQHYADRFLKPLEAEPTYAAEILVTLRAWFAAGRSIPRAAKALHVHVNTVRHRLGRFGELTGADLDDPDDLVGTRWVSELGAPPK